ncbi:MAG TPA: hypothetical protein VKZ86_11510 [Cyclobacteriaceae bacterium]|nr:hypothetical protein [Cyclobacteriaceae bacterium]
MKTHTCSLLFCVMGFALACTAQPRQSETTELTIIVAEESTSEPVPAWITVASDQDPNVAGWYKRRGPTGFPSFSPVQLRVPSGKLTITAWNHESDEVSIPFETTGPADTCRISLKRRLDLHQMGYFSFDSHNHLNGYDSINRPPHLYPYCAALGIDHLDLGQGWLFGLRMPVSYDSLIRYFEAKSTPDLSLRFGAEMPKLRYGHTWYVNHPGLEEPFKDYLKWHDPAFVDSMQSKHVRQSGQIDLRGTLRPRWHPPFVDRLRHKRAGAFAAAAHPTRWWNDGDDQLFPVTNLVADLAFDLLTAQSYDGLVVMGDRKDNIFYQNLWFHALNLGYRLIPVAETDGNVVGGSLGARMLTYAKTGGTTFQYDSLLNHIKHGHTTLSGRAFMHLTVDDNLPPGSVLPADGKTHVINVTVYSEPAADEYVSFLVLYRNGEPVEKVDLRSHQKRVVSHNFQVAENDDAWYVVKSYGRVYPEEDIQFDVIAYARQCLTIPNDDYVRNTGISLTAPVYFTSTKGKQPEIFVSDITATITDNGQPVPNLPVEVWNVDSCLAKLTTDKKGMFKISAPATIDVRFATPDGKQHQQWLFYEYPPLLDVMEYVYTLQWVKRYPGIQPGQMPWEALQYDELKAVLEKVNWEIRADNTPTYYSEQ